MVETWNRWKASFQSWVRNHPEELRVAGIGFAVAFFFTQGLPLWDDDYRQWLAQANGNFWTLLGRVLLPVTSEPQAWGYADRPLEALLYKIQFLFFGYWGTGYFFVKSVAFGALCASLFNTMKRFGVEKFAAYLATALLLLSTNALASVIQNSDYTVFSQLILLWVLMYGFNHIESGKRRTASDSLWKFSIIFFLSVYFGSKVKGDVGFAPLILLVYVALFARNKLANYAAPFGVSFLATLPWSVQFFKHLPPFVPGAAGYQGATYGAFSFGRVMEFLLGGLLNVRSASVSVLAAVGLLIAIAALAYAIYRTYLENWSKPDGKTALLIVWFFVALLCCGAFVKQPVDQEIRLTVMPLVPAILLSALFFQVLLKEYGHIQWTRHAMLAVVVMQCGLHFYHDCRHRISTGRTMVAVDKLYKAVEDKYANSSFAFSPGFPAYGYRDSVTPAMTGRRALASLDEVNRYPAGQVYLASWSSNLSNHYSLEMAAEGCGSALFDAIFRCSKADGAVLLKYVGPRPEFAQAEQLDRAGQLAAARDVLENYWKTDPGNHGVAFILGIYNYRLGDFARMERVYDTIGHYFPGHTSVLYNWALAKQGTGRLDEAAKYFELAYANAPKDYAIGFNLADTYYRQGRKRRALATLTELLQHYPNDGAMRSAYDRWSKK